MVRFIHSSDLHLGKRFGNLPEDLRGRLREERHAVIGRLADQARVNNAPIILLAGDTFDTETPTPAILRHALSAMADDPALQWVILPGNHDSLLADELWSAARQAAPTNVIFATQAQPIIIDDSLVILPAPCSTRRPGRDLTEWMDHTKTGDGQLRIGLAHGPIQTFCEDSVAADVIAPDRAARARLDYLALGDWHGTIRVNERTWYSGTPEPDRFKHQAPGQALLVSVATSGAPPEVQPIGTGQFAWKIVDLHFLPGDDLVQVLTGALPSGSLCRQILVRLVATGRLRLAQRSILANVFASRAPDFAFAALETGALSTECETTDLDLIDRGGALRQAAEALLSETTDQAKPASDRDIAREALARLFSYCEASEA